MKTVRMAVSAAGYNFRQWRSNPRIFITFALGFIFCFMLTNKAVHFSESCETTMQLVEVFIWTFGDSQSILLMSLLLILLFADMPFLSAITPYYLSRGSRFSWLLGQILYIVGATALFMIFVLIASCVLSMTRSFTGNQWSETASILGYSGAGEQVALPALVRTLERSLPYTCMLHIFLLMLLYSLTLVSLMLLLTLKKGAAVGIGGAFAFSLYGFLLNPQTLGALLQLPEQQMYRVNLMVGWLSPLNHAAYHMHSFGYDALPTFAQSWTVFGILIAGMTLISFRVMRRYSFHFRGTEE